MPESEGDTVQLDDALAMIDGLGRAMFSQSPHASREMIMGSILTVVVTAYKQAVADERKEAAFKNLHSAIAAWCREQRFVVPVGPRADPSRN